MPLHKAVSEGNLKKVRELLAAGTPVDERNEDGATPLMMAVMLDRQKIFRVLLDAGADVHAADKLGQTVLHYAAVYGTPAVVRAILERQPDVNARDARGETPLIAAQNTKVAELLLAAGADVHARRNDGLTALDICETARHFGGGTRPTKREQLLRAAGALTRPASAAAPAGPPRLPPAGTGRLRAPSPADVADFFTAAQTDDAARVRSMLEAGMPLDAVGRPGGPTVLHRAAARGCLRVIELLLAAGADRHVRDGRGCTALHAAAEGKQAEAASALIRAGLDVDARDATGNTPLMVAAGEDAPGAAEALLGAGAAVNARGRGGATALALARSGPMGRLLRDAGALNQKAARALPPEPAELLLHAAEGGDAARVRELLAAGVPVGVSVRYGETPLTVAVAGGHADAARVLLEAGADPHARDAEGGTLLHTAAWAESPEMVRFLLGRGLDPGAADRHGFTPLMAAAVTGDREAARLLLEAGADPAAKGDFGMKRNKTALEYARDCDDRRKRQALIELLTGAAAAADGVEAATAAVDGFARAARKPAFRRTLRILAEVCTQPPAPAKGHGGVYACAGPKAARLLQRYAEDAALRERLTAAGTSDARAALLLDRLRREVRAAGFQLIGAEADLSARAAELLLFPTPDKYAVIAARGTDGANYGHGTRDVIAWLQEMEKDNPFELTACGHDFLAGTFVRPVAGAGPLAERMCAFCPDLLDGDLVDDPAQVAESLEHGQGFFFWWD